MAMDRRRLEAAHFKYAMLKVVFWYPGDIDFDMKCSADLNDTLLKFTPKFQIFHKKYVLGIPGYLVFRD